MDDKTINQEDVEAKIAPTIEELEQNDLPSGEKKSVFNPKKLLCWTLVFIAVTLVSGALGYSIMTAVFSGVFAKDRTFKVDEMSITLNDSFSESFSSGREAAYSSSRVSVYIDKDPSAAGLGIKTPRGYAEYIIARNSFENCSVSEEDGIAHFIFTADTSEGTYKYFAYTYRDGENFWLIQFAVKENFASTYSKNIDKWAKSVRFE